MKKRMPFARSACAIAVALAIMPLAAQEGEAEQEADIERKGAQSELFSERIIVTGTASTSRTELESSVAITTVDFEGLQRKAPRSTADALELVPGIFVEDSGGEVSNNFSVRGLAGGAQSFIQLSEDGLPVFYTNALADTILKQDLSIDRLEAIRGGTSGVLTVNGAGATINFITRKATDEAEGSLRYTGSDFRTNRVDFWFGGPVSDEWYYTASGFYRSSDSVRDTQFTADQGGIARFSLEKRADEYTFGVNVKVVDDSNTFLLPIPLQNPSDPSGIPGFDPNFGTMLSLDNAVQTVRTSPQTGRSAQVNDLFEGVKTESVSIGYHFEADINDELILSSKGRYTDFKNRFNGIFNFDNSTLVPATTRLDPTQFGDIQVLLDRFGPLGAVRPGLQVVSTGEIIAGDAALNALNGNGLTADSITTENNRFVQEFVNDLSLTWETDRNALRVGLLTFSTEVRDDNIGATTFISEVADNPRRLDIVALDANDEVVGFLTENGILNYGTWGEGNAIQDATSYSLYVNEEYQVTDDLRLDAGIRYESFEVQRRESIGAGGPLLIPDQFDSEGNDIDNIIANNAIGQFGGGYFTGDFRNIEGDFSETSWTLGGSYTLTENIAFYGRYAEGYQANNQNPVTDITFGELGVRYQSRPFTASATLFNTTFEEFRFSRQPPGAIDPIEFNGDIDVIGVEFDLLWRPFDWLRIQALGVLQNTELDIQDDQGTGFASSFDGNQPERTPEENFRITPSYILPNGYGEIFFSVHHLGDRFSDLANSLELPSYTTIDAGVILYLTENITLTVNGQNLSNEIGLTEGNPRSGFTENPGVSDFFYARPILGRNYLATITYNF